jgi:succinate dehydrogenase/fumarate reductase flavoprotein subunit
VPIADDEPFVSVARVLIDEPVFAVFDRANANIQRWLRSGQANAFLPFDRMGIDPFKQRFPVGLRLEGTVRGTGGIRLCARDCTTDVPGLYAAGDAASRETVVGGRTGGGSPNSAWAIVTGGWAGAAASEFAKRNGPRTVARREEVALVRRHVWSLRTNLFRSAAVLTPAVELLDDAWRYSAGDAPHLAEARSARAMLYVARLAYRSALHRKESRALHRRDDHPGRSDVMRHRLVVRGVDSFEFSTDPVAT